MLFRTIVVVCSLLLCSALVLGSVLVPGEEVELLRPKRDRGGGGSFGFRGGFGYGGGFGVPFGGFGGFGYPGGFGGGFYRGGDR